MISYLKCIFCCQPFSGFESVTFRFQNVTPMSVNICTSGTRLNQGLIIFWNTFNAAIVFYYSNDRFIQIYLNILSQGEAETYEKWAVASFKVLSGEKKSCMMDMRWSAQCRRKLDLHTDVRAPRRKATAVFFSRIVINILMVEQLGDMLGGQPTWPHSFSRQLSYF